MPMNLPAVPSHLAGKGLSSIDYGICKARSLDSIGKLLIREDFQFEPFLDQLGKIFMQIVGDLGVKTLPDKAAEKRMIHYVANYYRDFTLLEIRKAFELAIVGELDVDIEHYNSFDIKYICKILNAYRTRRTKALRNMERAKPKEKEPEITPERKEQIRQQFMETICRLYEKYCRGGELNGLSLPYVYNLLIDEAILEISEQRWVELIEMAKLEYKKRLSRPKDKQERNAFNTILNNFAQASYTTEADNIKRIAKEIAVKEFFRDCKAKQVDLYQLLTKSTSEHTKSS